MRIHALVPAILAFYLWTPAAAEAQPAAFSGSYRLVGGPDTVSELVLRDDGTYSYWLMAGALDEVSEGHWVQSGSTASLTTEPKPVLPEFTRAELSPHGASAHLDVSWPNGNGIAGIDFRIGLSDNRILEGYTQYDGWQMSPDESAEMQWIELHEPIHRIASPRFALAPGTKTMRFTLVPNDLGLVDLTGSTAELTSDRLSLHRPEGDMDFVRAADSGDPP